MTSACDRRIDSDETEQPAYRTGVNTAHLKAPGRQTESSWLGSRRTATLDQVAASGVMETEPELQCRTHLVTQDTHLVTEGLYQPLL